MPAKTWPLVCGVLFAAGCGSRTDLGVYVADGGIASSTLAHENTFCSATLGPVSSCTSGGAFAYCGPPMPFCVNTDTGWTCSDSMSTDPTLATPIWDYPVCDPNGPFNRLCPCHACTACTGH